MKIKNFEDAKAAFDALYQYLGEEYCTHPDGCPCEGCEACGHAADGGTLMDGLIKVRDECGESDCPDPAPEGHERQSYGGWSDQRRREAMAEWEDRR